jgi:hypothetical protein
MPPITTAANTAPTPRKKRALLGFAVVAAVFLLGCCSGFFAGSAGETDPQVISSPSPYAVTTIVTASAAPVAAATSAAPTKPAPAPAATIDDGVWTVGEDFPAGTYKVREAVTQMCYWGIYKSGTNQSDIVDNDIVTGGKPTVTLKRGQDFKSSGCGTWVKVK